MRRRRIIGPSFPYLVAPVSTAAPSTTNSWDPLKRNANITLTNSNLTATQNTDGVFSCVMGVTGASSGKKYWEINITLDATHSNMLTGLASNTQPLTDGAAIGINANSIGYNCDGRVLRSSALQDTLATYTTGDVVCIAADLDNLKIWFRKNGGAWHGGGGSDDPATNTGGYPISGLTGGAPFFPGQSYLFVNDSITANFGASTYAQAAPTGFVNW